MSSKERNSIEVGWKPLFHWWLTINYVFFAFITQPLLYIQTVEAVRNNRFGPPRHDEPDFDSPAYRRARSFFGSNRANDSNTMEIEPPNHNNDDILLIGQVVLLGIKFWISKHSLLMLGRNSHPTLKS